MFLVKWLKPHELRFIKDNRTGYIFLALWFFVVRIDFWSKEKRDGVMRKKINFQMKKIEKIMRTCKVCGNELPNPKPGQIIKYHSECRHLRKHGNNKKNKAIVGTTQQVGQI